MGQEEEQGTIENSLAERYDALRDGVGYAPLSRGVVRLRGRDRTDLLHRLSTAEVARLSAGQVATTIITSEKGRVLDMVDLLERGEELLMVSSFAEPDETIAWIGTYTIMDDVETEDVSGDYRLLGLYGDAVWPVADALLGTGAIPPAGSLVRGEIGAEEVLAWRAPGLNGPSGLYLLGTPTAIDQVASRLDEAGAVAIDDRLYEVLRIEAGRPAAGPELGLQHNPLELGLVSHVSFTKGCYIGQEVIARLDSYDKVKNRLVGLRIQRSEVGADLGGLSVRSVADGDSVGRVTSAAASPGIGTIALALVRATHAHPDTPVEVVDPETKQSVAAGMISHLPFAD